MQIEKVYEKKIDCCGCSACFNACPKKAISMEKDEEGFLYPSINKDLCINCGLCQKVCAFKERDNKSTFIEGYAAKHNDNKVYDNSRSGGAFIALASMILEKNGYVFGVALDEHFVAKHICVSSKEDLVKLQGSKYVQSDKGETFKEIESLLMTNNYVLFSGVACEVAGLLSYLKIKNVNTDKLITVDIVCHGVPSPRVWKDNIENQIRKHGKLLKADFRDKRFGWKPHIESYTHQKKTYYDNVYTSIFYDSVALRRSCHICHFANKNRPGDITLADFWGSADFGVTPEPKGLSLVLINTKKGQDYFDLSKDKLKLEKIDHTKDIPQPNLHRPTPVNPKRDEFWKDYEKKGYRKTFKRYYGIVNHARLVYNKLRCFSKL